MDSQVDLAGQQGFFQLFGEKTLTFHFVKREIVYAVAGRRNYLDLDLIDAKFAEPGLDIPGLVQGHDRTA